jgi:hypothetical protein
VGGPAAVAIRAGETEGSVSTGAAPVASAAYAGTDPDHEVKAIFVFFSSRMGCLGSLLVTLMGTLILLVLLGVVD